MKIQEKITINNETEAFDLIELALENKVPDGLQITFKNWPIITIELEGEGYEGTITPSMMRSLIEFQTGLNKTYLKLVEDESNLNHLKLADKQELEFKAKVEDGCTLLSIDLSVYGQKVISDLMAKMDANHIVVFGVVALAIWVGGSIWKKRIETASHDKDVSQEAVKAIALSEQETKRLEIVTKAVAAQPKLAFIENLAEEATIGLLKGISDADSIELNGIKLNNKDAKSIAQSKRSEAIEIQLNGNYFIQAVDTSIKDEIKIKIQNLDNSKEFTAKFKDDSLDQNQIALLQEAEWSRPKNKVYLSVNATKLRDEITTATIIGVTKQP